jgi:hypothetical protein
MPIEGQTGEKDALGMVRAISVKVSGKDLKNWNINLLLYRFEAQASAKSGFSNCRVTKVLHGLKHYY